MNVSSAGEEGAADLALRNGVLITMDATLPRAEALAARDGRIVYVGDDPGAEPFIGPDTRVIDLGGMTAVPGFIEAHSHFMGLGDALTKLDLAAARSWDEIVGLVARKAAETPPGDWIEGRGWHQEKWDAPPVPNVEGYPVHDALSAASPNNPVILVHASGHMCAANAEAMRLAGVTRDTPDPPGGEILRDRNGEPIGVFRESAQGLVRRALEESRRNQTAAEREREQIERINLALRECAENGITSFHDAGASFDTIDLFKRFADEGKLTVRLWCMIGEGNEAVERGAERYAVEGHEDPFLSVKGLKRFMDGALGAHGAWLLEPYSDLPESAGLQVSPTESIREAAGLAERFGLQLCVHAIGDRANRETLDIFEEFYRKQPPGKELRWRVEHAQHIDPADIPRFGGLGVIASMQAVHCVSDGPYVIERLGETRAREGAYAWRILLNHGAVIANGADAPVEDIDPIMGFHAAVTREMRDGRAFFPLQRMTREEALRSYTLDAAFAAFEEEIKGSLTVGKLADIAVLTKNIMEIPADEIPSARVAFTIAGGKVAYEAGR